MLNHHHPHHQLPLGDLVFCIVCKVGPWTRVLARPAAVVHKSSVPTQMCPCGPVRRQIPKADTAGRYANLAIRGYTAHSDLPTSVKLETQDIFLHWSHSLIYSMSIS